MFNMIFRRFNFFFMRFFKNWNSKFVRNIIFALLLLHIIVSLVYWSTSNGPYHTKTISNFISQSYLATSFYTSEVTLYPTEPDNAYFTSTDDDPATSWWNILPTSLYDRSDVEKNYRLSRLSKLYEKLKFNTKPFWFDDFTYQNNLLKINIGPHKGEKVESINDLNFYDFDPRLTWSVYIDHVMGNFNDGNKLTLPFSWYDWSDFHELNKIVSLEETDITCNFLFEGAFDIETLNSIEHEIKEPLFANDRYKYENNKWYLFSRKESSRHIFTVISKHCKQLGIAGGTKLLKPKFSTGLNITQLFDKVRTEVFQLQARNALLTSGKLPISITVLSEEENTFQFNLKQGKSANLIESDLLPKYIEKQRDIINKNRKISHQSDPIDFNFNHADIFTTFLNNDTLNAPFKLDIQETDKDSFKQDYIELNPDDFEFDAYAKINELEAIPKDEISVHNLYYLNSLRNSVRTHPALTPKYFQEGRNIQQFKGMGHHRDIRFFNGDNLLNEHQEYFNRFNAMIRTFQKFTYSNGLISWLGHGTLYGYIYNGQTFPWDNDFDLQMPIKHLNYLAQYFNQSLVIEDPRYGNGRYLLDVSNSLTSRINGNGLNNIDARFIDVDTGLYIDITGLSVSDEITKDSMISYIEETAKKIKYDFKKTEIPTYDANPLDKFVEENNNFARLNCTQLKEYAVANPKEFTDEQMRNIKNFAKHETTDIVKSRRLEKYLIPRERYDLHQKLHIFNCRNNHFVTLADLSPLVNTLYHGVPALIQQKYITALQNEYMVPITYGYITFQGTTYLPDFRFWIDSKLIDKCTNLKNWYPLKNYEPLKKTKTLNDIKFHDIRILLHNIKNSKDANNNNINLLANIYNSFSSTSYRLKELELQYSNISLPLKQQYLHVLRKEISPRVTSPGKDAHIYVYERNMYEDLAREFDQSVIDQLESKVQDKYISIYWRLLSDLKYHRADMFNISTPVHLGGITNNLPYLDMNKINTRNLFSDPRKMPNQIFEKDPLLGF